MSILCVFVSLRCIKNKIKNQLKKLKIIMANKKSMASTASKRAIVIAMASIAGASVQQTSAAMRAAMQDMKDDLGRGQVYNLHYTWDPFDGLLA